MLDAVKPANIQKVAFLIISRIKQFILKSMILAGYLRYFLMPILANTGYFSLAKQDFKTTVKSFHNTVVYKIITSLYLHNTINYSYSSPLSLSSDGAELSSSLSLLASSIASSTSS